MNTPQHLSDRYQLREILGFGGMSEVHLARDARLDRDVAIKVLRADLARDPNLNVRFRQEAQKTAGLNHPAIVAVYDTGEAETPTGLLLPYIVMEFVDGQTLRDVVRTRGPMTSRRAIGVIAEVCSALEFSHRHGIIHRDVKPANILIGRAGAVKVVDFGIARALADSDISFTQTGAVIGTAHYLSPEQARGGKVDARSDVYSLGCVLYEISCGGPPFVGDSPVAVAYQHVREDPAAPSSRNGELTRDFDAVVLKALAKDPDERYQTAADMRVDLVRLQRGETPYAATTRTDIDHTSPLPKSAFVAPPTEHLPAQPTGDRRSLSRWLSGAAVLAVFALLLTIAIDTVAGNRRDVALPDLHGQTSADAIAILHSRGLTTHTQQKTHPTVPTNHVIDTEPGADAAARPGDEITVNVSSGPARDLPDAASNPPLLTVPDVSSLTYAEAVTKLMNAGFRQFNQASLPSTPELKDRVVGTNPMANRTAATTTEITIVTGSGSTTGGP